jgi:hypothetical protein
VLISEPGISIPWKYLPARGGKPGDARWLVVLGEDEPLAERPEWLAKAVGEAPVLLVSPRRGATRGRSAPFTIQRSLLVGPDRERPVIDVLVAPRKR